MSCLLDTVAVVRHFLQRKNIGKAASEILAHPDETTFYISIISLMEILYLSEKKRIALTLDKTLEEINTRDNYELVNLDREILRVAQSLHFHELHDRLILATTKYLGIPVLSSDHKFSEVKGITVIWD